LTAAGTHPGDDCAEQSSIGPLAGSLEQLGGIEPVDTNAGGQESNPISSWLQETS